MTTAQQQFLELLRAGLWGTPAVPEHFSPEATDWKAILRIAKEQTVLIIVADGIETLPKEFWPPKEMMLKIMMVRVKTAQMHQLMNATINQVVKALDAEGIPSVLLKGQGVAQNYRKPESRSCGDIDLYVGEENYKRACVIVENLDKDNPKHKPGIESDHHMHLSLNGIEIELHRFADYLPGRRANAHLQKWTKESIDAHFRSENINKWNNNGISIALAPPTFDAFFILHHAVRHMTVEGVSFRQICDWVMYLDKHHDEINEIELKEKLTEFQLNEIWHEFSIIAKTILGRPSIEHHESNITNFILLQIFESGNFGRYDINARDYTETSYIKGKWRSFKYQIARLYKLYKVFPKFILNYLYTWIAASIALLVRGK